MILPVAIVVICLGLYGVLVKRDVIRILIGASLMLSGSLLIAVALGAQAIVPFAWIVEVAEVVIAIALYLRLARKGVHDVTQLRRLRW